MQERPILTKVILTKVTVAPPTEGNVPPLPHLTGKKDQAGSFMRVLSKLGILIFPAYMATRFIQKISAQGQSKQSTILIVMVVVSFSLASGIVLWASHWVSQAGKKTPGE